jgi:hypothetical protein
MDTPKGTLLRWLLCLVVSALAAGCTSSASSRREDASGAGGEDRETVEQLPDESAYREAAERLLAFLEEQRQTGASVIPASGKDGIYPMYECMEYGCPDKVFCKEANAYCHVTHCGKGSCRGCGESFPDILKNLAIKEWCKFDCLRRSTRAGTAFGFVPIVGKNFFVGPICLDE